MMSALIVGCGGGGGSSGVAVPIAAPVAPSVISTNPSNAATAVPINNKILALFSTAMDPATLNTSTFTVTGPGASLVTGTVTYTGTTALFTPSANLNATTLYTATITTGAKNTAGTPMAVNYVWTFTTSAATDIIALDVNATSPANNATGIALNRNITATFNKSINPATLSASSYTLTGPGTTPVAGAISYIGSTAIFTPSANLTSSTLYTATLTTGITDLASNAMAANHVWTFTTGTAIAAGPDPVNLGTSGTFAILTKTGITDSPASVITGNIGSSPITGAAIGVTCPEVNGTIYQADAAGTGCFVTNPTLLTTAVLDMESAYTDAAGRTAGVGPFLNLGAGTLTNLTLAPGIYTWGSNVTIPTDLTLNGGPNDVWIFQISGTLDIASAKQIILSGGAQAKNIFWQVADVVSLQTNSHFEGIIVAKTNIALFTGASINGRLLAQTATTLQSNTVTAP